MPTAEQVTQALAAVDEPQIGKPITELGMVADVSVDGRDIDLRVLVTVPDHPLKDQIRDDVTRALAGLDDVGQVRLSLEAMSDEQRSELASQLRPEQQPHPGSNEPIIPFSQAESDTQVVAVASGKGGVGKSTVTTNLAAALAADGYRVGVLDADIWGYSIPRMLGVQGRPVAFNNIVMPLQAYGCKVISIGFFIDTERPVIWRGPMLHRALQQFLADVYWGELDFLFCDLPPGTGDIAISLAQMLPGADMLVCTTPQQAAQRVALRAGQTTEQTGMKVGGVIENMAGFTAPDTGVSYDLFGEGGGDLLAAELDTKLLGSVPMDPRLRQGADAGIPLFVSDPDAPASKVFADVASQLAKSKRSLVGKSLPLQS